MPLTPHEPPRRAHKFDIIAYDGHDTPVLVVEIKRSGDVRSLEQLVEDTKRYVESAPRHALFFLIANPDNIYVYKHEANSSWTLARTFDAPTIFRHYDNAYGENSIYEHYLNSLVQAWLNDISYNWHTQSPPERGAFEELGLLTILRDGSMAADAML